MIFLVYIWSLVLLCGVFGDSSTSPEVDQPVSSTPEALNPEPNSDSPKHDFTSPAGHEEEWKTYSPDVYPLFRKAVKELASSEQGILIFWDSLNRPEPPRAFYEQVFRAYNRLADGDIPSTTEESEQAALYSVETTDTGISQQEASEMVSGIYTVEDGATESNENLGAVLTSDGDELDVYYTSESPGAEAVVLDQAYYASSIVPEQSVTTEYQYAEDASDVYQDAKMDAEATSEASDSDASSESIWDDVHRSGDVVGEPQTPNEPLRVGSIRGIPGEDFPCYEEIPITSFSCADKRIPGVYADLETGCQVFHVCWPHRRESFLCPIGTIFNQPISACDYWYSANCSLSNLEFSTKPPTKTTPGYSKSTTEGYLTEEPEYLSEDWFRLSKFVPVKSKVTVYFKPEGASKHKSAKKPVSKVVIKQKHDVLPIVEEFLELTKNVAHDVVKLVPKVVKPAVVKTKVTKKPAAKLEPCLEIQVEPTPPVVMKPKPLPTLDPRFIVTPVVGEKPVVKVHYEKKSKIIAPKVHVKKINPVDMHKVKLVSHNKEHASEIVMKVLEMAGDVFQRDILALTRQALAEDYEKDHQKHKH